MAGTPVSISNSDLEALRKRSDKVFQHYNWRAAQKTLRDPTFMANIQKDGFIIAKEITNLLNQPTVRSETIRCHTRKLLNTHALALADGLNGVPIEENEPYYLFVRFKVTGSNSLYFNLDFYLPNRNTAPKTPKIIKEIVHFSIHSSPDPPYYKSEMIKNKNGKAVIDPVTKKYKTRLTDEVNEARSTAVDFKGMIHAYESQYIDGIPPHPTDKTKQVRPLRKFLLLLHKSPGETRANNTLVNSDYRKEFVLVSQRNKGGGTLNLHPMSTLFMQICIETLQTYFDNNYSRASFTTLYEGPRNAYSSIPASSLPNKPADIAKMIKKDNGNKIKWGQITSYHQNLASEMTARIKRMGGVLKMEALDYFVQKNYGGKYTYSIKLKPTYPSTSCLKDIFMLLVTSQITDNAKTFHFKLSIHFRWDAEKDYTDLELSSISFKNVGTLSATDPTTLATYNGYIVLKNIEPSNGSQRFYTLDGTTINPLYQIKDLTSISVRFGEIATKVMSDFIASGYDPTSLNTSFYDCSSVTESEGPVAPPADQAKGLPRYGGGRTRSARIKRRSTRKQR